MNFSIFSQTESVMLVAIKSLLNLSSNDRYLRYCRSLMVNRSMAREKLRSPVKRDRPIYASIAIIVEAGRLIKRISACFGSRKVKLKAKITAVCNKVMAKTRPRIGPNLRMIFISDLKNLALQ